MSGQGSASSHQIGGTGGYGASGGSSGAGASGASGSSGETSGGSGSGGVAGNGGSSGSQNGGSSGASGGSGSGSGGGGGGSPGGNCSDLGGVELEQTGHCYVPHENGLDWHGAREHCEADGGHLVTLDSELENDLVWGLFDGHKWLGASDGRAAGQFGAGTYAWVTGESMDYLNWTPGQPNAAIVQECPENPGAGPITCYEHCAYQWNPDGYGNEGQWNDQGCWLVEGFVCEFE